MALRQPRDYLLESALEYAGTYGLQVLPLHSIVNGRCTCSRGGRCNRPGKHPRTRHGVKDATSDPRVIENWLTSVPESNLGIATGAGTGIFALDVDSRHGGDQTLDQLQRRYGKLPATVASLTGGGGRHLIFGHTGDPIPSSQGMVGPGIDVRADGGYIASPPSLHHSGREYAWDLEHGLGQIGFAPMPDWLVELCVGRPRRRERRATTAGRHARFRWPEALDGVHEGRRHTSIFLMASSLRGQGTPEAVVRELALVAAARCRPPLPPAEALAVLDDVFDRYATNASRARTLSEERIDVLAVLATAVSPLQPAAVALLLGKNREAIKQLMVKMLRDDQVRRVPGGYGLSIPATSTNISHFPVAGAANETPLHPAQHAPRTRL